ncbi:MULTISPECIES: tyrosine-type recombinase/integrase [Streptomyces]|uniref:tyrosine-type recombinase/integrase n=1 Tax=Streptomyces TaxID=1883 RepID=UPI0027E38189|nr:tyrosine-type recombinase/integrase [Streptomyces sp. IpFD-1.1]
MHPLAQEPPGKPAGRTSGRTNGLHGQRPRLHHRDRQPSRPHQPDAALRPTPPPIGQGFATIRFHDLRHSTATLLLQQGVDLVVIKELLGHAHIGVTAGVYAHVRLRLQRQAVDCLNNALNGTEEPPDDPPAAALAR